MRIIKTVSVGLLTLITSVALVGCTPIHAIPVIHPSTEANTIADVRAVPGVTHVSPIERLDAFCETVCADGSVIATVTSTLSGAALVALRDRIIARIDGDKSSSRGLVVTLQRGADEIPLRAPDSQYQFLEQVRHDAAVRGVLIVTGLPPQTVTITSRLTVLVASKSDVLAGYTALEAATTSDHEFTPGHTSVEARTGDYLYSIDSGISPTPATLGPLATTLFNNAGLAGAHIDPGNPGQQGSVFVTAAGSDEVVDAYFTALPIVADYPNFRLAGSMAGNFQLVIDSTVAPTDPAFGVVQLAADTGANLGITVVQRQIGYNATISFAVSSAADARLLNHLATTHPAFRSELDDFTVVYATSSKTQSWKFGVRTIG